MLLAGSLKMHTKLNNEKAWWIKSGFIWNNIHVSFNLNLLINSFKEKNIYWHCKFESVVQTGGLGLKSCSFPIQENRFAFDFDFASLATKVYNFVE